MKPSGNTILITGGGSGIGEGLASELYRAGNSVIIAGRRRDMLEKVVATHPGMEARVLDISNEQDIHRFASDLTGEFPALNILMNNAGIMQLEQDIDPAIADATITTNLLGPIRLTAALLPHLRTKADAAVINVSSGLAFVPYLGFPTYCATKAALHSWTIALGARLQKDGVEVIEIIPPAVQTELTPGQSSRKGIMSLPDFIAETMEGLTTSPTPAEIRVGAAKHLGGVVDDARFQAAFAQLNRLGSE